MTDQPPALRKLCSFLVFPVLITAGLLTAKQLIDNGTNPAIAALVAVLIFGFICIPILERLLPYRAEWNQNDADLGTDLLHMLVNSGIPRLWTPLQIAALSGLTIWVSERFGGNLWPQDLHWLTALLLMLLIAEFGRYWVHYAAHKNKWLWRLHAVHHSPNRLYFLNANRFHPLEKLIFQIPEVAPFIILGTPAEIIALYFVFNGLHGLTQHSNIDIKAGPLNYIFSLTELHRWHHSQQISESDKNFGNNLIVWDIVFGSYFNPTKRQVERIGLLNPDYPKTWLRLLLNPFASSDLSKPEGYQAKR